MNLNWDLSVLYNGFEDPKYASDLKALEEAIKAQDECSKKLSLDNALECITNYLKLEEKIASAVYELYSYSSLRMSANVNDMEAAKEAGKLQIMMQEGVTAGVLFKKFMKDVDLSIVNESDYLKQYEYMLSNIKKDANHLLSDKEEILYSKLSMVGSDSWSEIQSKLTSNLSIKVKGFKDPMPLSAVRNLAYDNSKTVRKNAYLAELKACKEIEASVAMALNNIKREVNIMLELRGYKNALDVTLSRSNMGKKALDAMIEAIKEELPKFREYYKLKAKALGYKNGLPFYEIFAPMGKMTKTYTYEEAKELVLDVYYSFSDKLGKMGEAAFNNGWIDVLPKEGKVGGAFCASVPNHKVSRVLTNFTGSLGDVQTLAHELGHAYHNHVIYDNAPLNQDYPMQLAETASILCQTLMAKKMINDIDNNEEKLTVLEQSLQEDTQCVVDILSRFLFESKVVDTPVAIPLSSEDLCGMMLEAQDESYGDGLDPEYRHQYMWLVKSHYYSTFSFYNWPYAFGLLYGKGLYKVYMKDKESFVKNYDEMLKNTCLMDVEDVAKTMGIDITDKAFWKESLSSIYEDILEFGIILKELKMI